MWQSSLKAIYVPKGCVETYKSALARQYIDYGKTTLISSLIREIGDTIETAEPDASQIEDEVADTQTSNERASDDSTTPILPIIIAVVVVAVIAGGAVVILKKKK